MAQGSLPPRNRELLGVRIPQPPPLPTLIPTMSVEMMQGSTPPQPILKKPPPLGWSVRPFEGEIQDAAQSRGHHPDLPRLFLAPRIPLPLAQVTPVAINTPELYQGWIPLRPILGKPFPVGWLGQTPEVISFSPEQAQGSHLDLPRLFLAPRFMQPPVPLTPVGINSPDMFIGWHPDRATLGKPFPSGWTVWTPEVSVFEIAETFATRPTSPRLFVAPRFIQPPSQLTQINAPFSIEMVLGWRPSTGRPRFGPQIPSQLLLPLAIPLVPVGAERWAPVGYTLHVQEQTSGTYFAQLTGEDGVTPIPGTLLTSLLLSLYSINQQDNILILAHRDRQNVLLPSSGVVVSPGGLIKWTYTVADTTLSDPTIPFERHIGLFEYGWLGGSGKIEVILVVHNLRRVG
jgi:hypothetical protein